MDIPQYRSLSAHTLVATTLLLTLGLITVVSIISTVSEIGLLQQISDGGAVSEADANRNDSRQALLGYLYIGGFVAAAIAFLAWLNCASENLASLGADGQRFSPGWAVGWWFVPIMWLFRPYQVVKEVWQGSHPLTESNGPADWRNAPVSPLLGFWWATWLLSNWAGTVTARLLFTGDTVQDLIQADWLSVISSAISLVALALILILIRQITSNQARKRSVLQSVGQSLKTPESHALPNAERDDE